ncbi:MULTISPECIES: hypothetical protein [Corallincola]|uniref:DUF4136 domain-containing protein n=3 Tax=Corallincola TaxID=1775176 RepID=A0A368NMY7_9GAMM|nr:MULTISPECIES: hypothetical protein [Corallincola]RCU50829.1 hypothetical protein DU002_05745 [Corallincola holothuriorum]TAA45787.1 hypothetical protein EXY25_10535 [Corallincola spongiicola]TCI03885.1 hypothetical protein EZV61_06735 [Corallincola luteus]
MITLYRAIVVTSLYLLLSGCAVQSTKQVEQWQDPNPHKPFTHVLVVGVIYDPAYQYFLEKGLADSLASEGVKTSLSSELYPRLHEMEREEVVKRLAEDGIDGVLLVRPVGQETITTYVPAHLRVVGVDTYRGWYGYFYQSYRYARIPATSYETFVMRAESALFDVATEEAVWTLTTDTEMVLDSPSAAVDSLVAKVGSELPSLN